MTQPLRERLSSLLILAASLALAAACDPHIERPDAPAHDGVYSFAHGCYVMDATPPGSTNTRWLQASADGAAFMFSALEPEAASRFHLRAADLGVYLFYDTEAHYLVADDGPLRRESDLISDVVTNEDGYVSGGEWELVESSNDASRFALRHLRSERYLGVHGLVDDEASAAVIALYPAEGCAEFPELSLDAEGTPTVTQHPDGDLFGIVDTHSHIFSNAGFGGGGVFFGAPFHRLGVEHALPDCSMSHGVDGRQDLFGYGFDQGDSGDTEQLLTAFVTGRTPEPNHATAGYPEFTDWPNGPTSSTHQTQYYRWIERAWLAGLRLIVQHATSNEVVCELLVGSGAQPARYSCNDMVGVDRQIEGAYAMERYIDAQEGGPGMGWFRIVRTPAEARAVIGEGKLAVLLGIEVSNLFDCYHFEREGFSQCDEATVRERMDRYEDMGVRVIFPVHKYDNAFSAGDGDRTIIEIGNFVNSGHFSSFTEECPDVPTVFDSGDVAFGGLNMPRDDYDATPPNDLSDFGDNPIAALSPYLGRLTEPALEGDYCQTHGLTPLGETLIGEIMSRGMILEIDHFNRRAYQRAFEIIEAADYPAAGTHGMNNNGLLYELGGISKTGLGRCRDPERPGSMGDRLRSRVAALTAAGAYPAEGFGFDLNGFAGAPGPRMGENSRCGSPQEGPTQYPLTSFAGDTTFSPPQLANRSVDFDTEGFVHIGLLPELIDDARRDGVTDAELEPLFRSAEGYIRMWERAEERGATM